jgi:ADP-heptose:LPS heptosyltransferase
LRELTALFHFTKLVIGVDTGPLHIADATDTRVVGLYGPTDPVRTGPWPRLPSKTEVLVAPGCNVCRSPRCRNNCMENIKPRDVLEKLSLS